MCAPHVPLGIAKPVPLLIAISDPLGQNTTARGSAIPLFHAEAGDEEGKDGDVEKLQRWRCHMESTKMEVDQALYFNAGGVSWSPLKWRWIRRFRGLLWALPFLG